MKLPHRILIAVGFVVLFGMQVVMVVILCKPDGIRIHAPMPGIAVPLSTTIVGDAWMKGGVSSIAVSVRGADGAAWAVSAERDTIKYRGTAVSVLAGWHATVTFKAPGAYTILATATSATDGRTLSTAVRSVTTSPASASRQFGFVSVEHLAALAVILAACVIVPVLARRSSSPAVRDRGALVITLILWTHELVYEIYWFVIGAWTVGNCLLLHMCGLALMFLPFAYFSRDGKFRQYVFEILYFFGLGGAMQALFTPDIGMHGFPEFKYFSYFLSHGTIVLGVIYAAAVYRIPLRWMSVVRIAVVTTIFSLVMFGVNRVFPLFPPYELGNYFIMGYPPPTGSIIDVFASIFGPAPRYLVGLELMGAVVLAAITAPYWVRWLSRARAGR